jgi:hypothetical protein
MLLEQEGRRMDALIRVGGKFLGALVLIVILLALCLTAGYAIMENTRPTDTVIYFLAMSAFSGLLIAILTVYRLITTLRSATLTLLLTAPMLVSLMSGVIIWWRPIKALAITEAPWTANVFDVVQQFLDFLDRLFG